MLFFFFFIPLHSDSASFRPLGSWLMLILWFPGCLSFQLPWERQYRAFRLLKTLWSRPLACRELIFLVHFDPLGLKFNETFLGESWCKLHFLSFYQGTSPSRPLVIIIIFWSLSFIKLSSIDLKQLYNL